MPPPCLLPAPPSQVHETYQRLAGMVDEQGEELDKAETNVIDAQVGGGQGQWQRRSATHAPPLLQASTEAGVGHLTKAASYQKQYGRCLLILVAILLVIALGVGGYFGYKAVRACGWQCWLVIRAPMIPRTPCSTRKSILRPATAPLPARIWYLYPTRVDTASSDRIELVSDSSRSSTRATQLEPSQLVTSSIDIIPVELCFVSRLLPS